MSLFEVRHSYTKDPPLLFDGARKSMALYSALGLFGAITLTVLHALSGGIYEQDSSKKPAPYMTPPPPDPSVPESDAQLLSNIIEPDGVGASSNATTPSYISFLALQYEMVTSTDVPVYATLARSGASKRTIDVNGTNFAIGSALATVNAITGGGTPGEAEPRRPNSKNKIEVASLRSWYGPASDTELSLVWLSPKPKEQVENFSRLIRVPRKYLVASENLNLSDYVFPIAWVWTDDDRIVQGSARCSYLAGSSFQECQLSVTSQIIAPTSTASQFKPEFLPSGVLGLMGGASHR